MSVAVKLTTVLLYIILCRQEYFISILLSNWKVRSGCESGKLFPIIIQLFHVRS